MKPNRIPIERYRNILVLTGAGVSVASGLRPYRGPGGVWEEYKVEEYAHSASVVRQPARTWELFGSMRDSIREAIPNAAHLSLAYLESQLRPEQNFVLATQNVDGLHRAAGSKNVAELHGNLSRTKCSSVSCDLAPFMDADSHSNRVPLCPKCSSPLRPDIVLFGELPQLDATRKTKVLLRDCDLFLAIGTSGLVSPAADYVRSAEYVGARTIYINLEPMARPNPAFKEQILGRAEELLPEMFGFRM